MRCGAAVASFPLEAPRTSASSSGWKGEQTAEGEPGEPATDEDDEEEVGVLHHVTETQGARISFPFFFVFLCCVLKGACSALEVERVTR